MLLNAAHVLGLRAAESWEADELGAVVELPPPPVGIAIADGLSLLHAVLDPDRARDILERLELLGPEPTLHLDEHGFLEQVVGLDAAAVASLLHDARERKAFVAVSLALDPVLYGRLREESLRDPRVVTALGQDPTLGLKVGWLFTRDLTAGSVTVLDVRVGDLSFPVNSSERPAWMSGLLREVGSRFARPVCDEPHEQLAHRLLDAMLSPRPERRAAWQRLSAACREAPFGFGALQLVQTPTRARGAGEGGAAVAFGDELTPLRRYGPDAARRLRVAAAALLDAPDVLILDEPLDASLRDWVVSCTTGPDATLEQVVLAVGTSDRGEASR